MDFYSLQKDTKFLQDPLKNNCGKFGFRHTYKKDRWTSDILSSEKFSRASRSGEIIIFVEDPTMNIPTKFVPIAPVVSEKKAKI